MKGKNGTRSRPFAYDSDEVQMTQILPKEKLLKQGHWKQQNKSFDEGYYDSWELLTYHSTPMWYVVLSIVPLVPYDFKGVCHYTLYPIWGCHILQSLGSFSTGLATFWSVSSTSTELIVFFDFFLHGRNCWSLRLSFWPNTCCIKGKCLEHQRCKASYNAGRSIWTPGSQEQTLRPLLFSRSTQQFAGGCSVQVKQVVFPVVCFPVVFYRLNCRGYLGYLFSWSPRVWGIQIQRRYGFDLNCRIGRACDISQHSKKLLNFYWLQPFFLLFSGGGALWKGIGDCLKTRIASKPGSSWQTIPTVACLVI